MTTPLSSATATVAAPTLTARFAGLGATARSAAAAPDSAWVPLVSGALILAVGTMSLATGAPWLFAGLGPTAFSVAASPGHATNRLQNIVVGHTAALAIAYLAVLLVGAGDAPTLFAAKTLPIARVWASALAITTLALVQPSLRAYHPPAAATALLVTLGAYRMNWHTMLNLFGGVVLVAFLGAWFQKIRIAGDARRQGRARG
ncbi:MAG: hypothetical protein NVS1B4_19050 [Gemmatimonadaceae bacterium]